LRLSSRFVATALLGVALAALAVANWLAVIEFWAGHRPFARDAYFAPGLVAVVEAVRARGCARVAGPHPEVSPYLFQRMTEMLYPILYDTPLDRRTLSPGTVYILTPGMAIPVASRAIGTFGDFRLMEACP